MFQKRFFLSSVAILLAVGLIQSCSKSVDRPTPPPVATQAVEEIAADKANEVATSVATGVATGVATDVVSNVVSEEINQNKENAEKEKMSEEERIENEKRIYKKNLLGYAKVFNLKISQVKDYRVSVDGLGPNFFEEKNLKLDSKENLRNSIYREIYNQNVTGSSDFSNLFGRGSENIIKISSLTPYAYETAKRAHNSNTHKAYFDIFVTINLGLDLDYSKVDIKNFYIDNMVFSVGGIDPITNKYRPFRTIKQGERADQFKKLTFLSNVDSYQINASDIKLFFYNIDVSHFETLVNSYEQIAIKLEDYTVHYVGEQFVASSDKEHRETVAIKESTQTLASFNNEFNKVFSKVIISTDNEQRVEFTENTSTLKDLMLKIDPKSQFDIENYPTMFAGLKASIDHKFDYSRINLSQENIAQAKTWVIGGNIDRADIDLENGKTYFLAYVTLGDIVNRIKNFSYEYDFGFGNEGAALGNIPAGTDIVYDLTATVVISDIKFRREGVVVNGSMGVPRSAYCSYQAMDFSSNKSQINFLQNDLSEINIYVNGVRYSLYDSIPEASVHLAGEHVYLVVKRRSVGPYDLRVVLNLRPFSDYIKPTGFITWDTHCVNADGSGHPFPVAVIRNLQSTKPLPPRIDRDIRNVYRFSVKRISQTYYQEL